MIDLIITYEDCTVTFTLKNMSINRPVIDSVAYVDLLIRYPNLAGLLNHSF